MSVIKEKGTVISQEKLADGIYSLWLQTDMASAAVPGQFVSLYSRQDSLLLPRPISICEINRQQSALRLVYRVAGKGTAEFSGLQAGDGLEVMGPLGNGFPLQGSHPIIVGGGIGVPPMLELSKKLNQNLSNEDSAANHQGGSLTMVLGYRNNQLFLKEQFDALGTVLVATDDGSVGCKGTVVDAMMQQHLTGDVMYACGPKPMLAAVKAYAATLQIPCYVSLEERMACGIGACLGCVCKTGGVDEHSRVHNARVCKDGPIFLAEEVDLG
jgi:dihydroorotate dehydrogenase electron transfer subunit